MSKSIVSGRTGSIHCARVLGTVFHNEEQVPDRLVGIIQDIAAQTAYADEIQRQVVEKTRDLNGSGR